MAQQVHIKPGPELDHWRAGARSGMVRMEGGGDRRVAILADPDDPARDLRAEKRVLSKLQVPGLLKVLHLGRKDGAVVTVVEAFPGASAARLLREHRSRGHLLPLRASVELVVEAARVLQALPEQLDGAELWLASLSPAELLVGADGQVRLPVPRALPPGAPAPAAAPDEPPGGARGAPGRAWQVGELLCELLTGERPVRARGAEAHEAALHRTMLSLFARPGEEVPPALAQVLEGCLAWAPEARPPMSRLVRRLQRALWEVEGESLSAWAAREVGALLGHPGEPASESSGALSGMPRGEPPAEPASTGGFMPPLISPPEPFSLTPRPPGLLGDRPTAPSARRADLADGMRVHEALLRADRPGALSTSMPPLSDEEVVDLPLPPAPTLPPVVARPGPPTALAAVHAPAPMRRAAQALAVVCAALLVAVGGLLVSGRDLGQGVRVAVQLSGLGGDAALRQELELQVQALQARLDELDAQESAGDAAEVSRLRAEVLAREAEISRLRGALGASEPRPAPPRRSADRAPRPGPEPQARAAGAGPADAAPPRRRDGQVVIIAEGTPEEPVSGAPPAAAPLPAPTPVDPGPFRVRVRSADPTVSGLSLRCHQGAGAGDTEVVLEAAGPGPCRLTAQQDGRTISASFTLEAGGDVVCFEGESRGCR